MEKRLNAKMKCHAGRGQVFIRSLIAGKSTTRPRICLRCHIRRSQGIPYYVYYEYIRDVCCANPDKCDALERFKAKVKEKL
jgi:hypothetical protein